MIRPPLELELKDGWTFRQVDGTFDISKYSAFESDTDEPEGWRKVKHMPSDVYVELKESGDIPDPFIGFNEHKVQWIAEKEWVYRTTVILSDETIDAFPNFVLDFEGLDTICNVYFVCQFMQRKVF